MRHPFPCNLRKECDHASAILESGSVKDTKSKVKSVLNTIPPKLFRNCKGVAIATLAQMSILLGGVKGGSGVVLKHDPKTDEWSDPIGFGLAGGLFGFQFGIAAIDLVMILTTDNAVKAFARGNVTLGGEIGCAIGPHGRTLEGDIAIMNISPVITYSFSRGLLFSMSVEGVGIIQRPDSNKKFYGEDVESMDVLNGFKDLQPVKPQGSIAIRRLHKCLQMRGTGETFKDNDGSLSPENVPPSRPRQGSTKKPRAGSHGNNTSTPAATTGYATDATKNTGGYQKSTYTAKSYGKKSPSPEPQRASSTPPVAAAAATGYAASTYKSSGYGANNTDKSTYTSSGYGSNKASTPSSTYASSGYKSSATPQTTYTPPATSSYSRGGGYSGGGSYNNQSSYDDYDSKPALSNSTGSTYSRDSSSRSGSQYNRSNSASNYSAQNTSPSYEYKSSNSDHKKYLDPNYDDTPALSYDRQTSSSSVNTNSKGQPIPKKPQNRSRPVKVKCLYDYDADQAGDLTIAEGDIIYVTQRDSDWWTGTNQRTKKKGIFPSTYVTTDV